MKKTALQVVERDIGALRPYVRNARTHFKKQIRQIATSIERFGFTNPVLVSEAGEIIAGHGRVEAAKLLGRKTVPTLALSHLSEAERRAYVLADNKLALSAGWDKEILAIELQALVDLEFDVELTGFSLARICSETGSQVSLITVDCILQSEPKLRCRIRERIAFNDAHKHLMLIRLKCSNAVERLLVMRFERCPYIVVNSASPLLRTGTMTAP